uniref:Uncharacterized protein n=1 Tax=Angiostrongylus cantonensis TaxID=6313 RepID=A0A0K0CUH4_ANGCA
MLIHVIVEDYLENERRSAARDVCKTGQQLDSTCAALFVSPSPLAVSNPQRFELMVRHRNSRICLVKMKDSWD